MGTGLHPPQLVMVYDAKHSPLFFKLIHSACFIRETLHICTDVHVVMFAVLGLSW